MTQHTARLYKGYLTKTKSNGVLHQMTWLPQSPDLNPIEMVWEELDRRVKEKQPTSAQHMWELLQDCWNSIPHEAGWENAKSVQNCHQGKGWLLWRIYSDLFNTFLVTTSFHMCYFIVLMSSLLFYNVENSTKSRNTLEWVGVSKILTCTIYYVPLIGDTCTLHLSKEQRLSYMFFIPKLTSVFVGIKMTWQL